MIPDRYNMENLRSTFNNPSVICDEILRINRGLNRQMFGYKSSGGVNVLDRDWDTLIILDGCRYDIFEKNNGFEELAQPIVSQGAHSREFIQKTFADKKLHDTVYITSNPWSEQLQEDTFFLKRETYTPEDKSGKARLPRDVSKLAIETFEEYPDKRYIVHFMQPNNPYVGPKAEQLRHDLLSEKNILCTELNEETATDHADLIDEVPNLRRALKNGYITRSQMLEVYIENLEIVTQYAMDVIEELGGKTAVTADHGDMFGERLPPLFLKDYSHWEGVYSESLRSVPWLVVDSENRREIRSEAPLSQDSMEDDAVREHLKSMGYLS